MSSRLWWEYNKIRIPELVVLNFFIVLVVSIVSAKMWSKATDQSQRGPAIPKMDSVLFDATTTDIKHNQYMAQYYYEGLRQKISFP